MNDERPDEHLLREASELILVSAGDDGRPVETALHFAYQDGVVCLLAPPGADWYRHVERDGGVVVRIQRRGFRGRARVVDARRRAKIIESFAALYRQKYGSPRESLAALLPVTVDMQF